MFSETTRSILEQAGWNEDRRVDTSEYERLLKADGYPVHPIQLEFLVRFGGLHVAFRRQENIFNINVDVLQWNDFHFDVALAIDHAFPENVANDSKIVGTPLLPIGGYDYNSYLLVIASDGKVYSIVDDYIDLIDSSGEDAIEAMCTGRPSIPIYPPYP